MIDENSSLPQRSQQGLAATDVFYRDYNKFCFYVEDEDQENLYFVILKELFPEIEFEKIFPLSGKRNVLAHAKDASNQSIENRVYILDKDFDDLLGTKENLQGVFYLDSFCIENYLIQEEALIEIVIESNPKECRREIKDRLSLRQKSIEIKNDLRPLFALFYLCQFEELGVPNCGKKPESFCKESRLWEICPELLAGYITELSCRCKQLGIAIPAEPISTDPRLSNFVISLDNEVVSGKFWLKLLFNYIKSNYKLGNITFDSFVFRVAKNCAYDNLKTLVDDVEATYAA